MKSQSEEEPKMVKAQKWILALGVMMALGTAGLVYAHGHGHRGHGWGNHYRVRFIAKTVNMGGDFFVARDLTAGRAIRKSLRKCRRNSIFGESCRVVTVKKIRRHRGYGLVVHGF
jgi:hypothetical protein